MTDFYLVLSHTQQYAMDRLRREGLDPKDKRVVIVARRRDLKQFDAGTPYVDFLSSPSSEWADSVAVCGLRQVSIEWLRETLERTHAE